MGLIFVLNYENFNICVDKLVCGIPRNTSRLENAKEGDFVYFYAKAPVSVLFGVYEVESAPFIDSKKIWPGGIFPYRVKIREKKHYEIGIPWHELIDQNGLTIKPGSFYRSVRYTSEEDDKILFQMFEETV